MRGIIHGESSERDLEEKLVALRGVDVANLRHTGHIGRGERGESGDAVGSRTVARARFAEDTGPVLDTEFDIL